MELVQTPDMEKFEEGSMRRSLHLEDLLEQRSRYQYTSWCTEHAIQVDLLLP